MKLGVVVSLAEGVDASIKKVKDLALSTCQVVCWEPELFTRENARLLKESVEKFGVEITHLWVGWPGPRIWNFIEGPITLGLVPPEYRYIRLEALKKGSDFARLIGIENVVTHVGFIPENPNDPLYPGLVSVLREIVRYCKSNGQYFCFETGQETPTTLLRTIEDIGMDNIGVNLDPANLLMYGKANPVDALDIIGKFVRGVHAKDGEYPTGGRALGVEKPLGEGRVNYPLFISKLKACGYDGALTIEREISGEQQIKDILKAKEFLSRLI
ncbi:MAG: sugar phosphate isomerase/epimerase [bacterium]|nr:sugar phosphate isomerase/epimerase [bacterium]